MPIKDTKENRIRDFLGSMKPGTFTVSRANDPEFFVKVVKEIIDEKSDWYCGFGLEFNDNFSILRKVEIDFRKHDSKKRKETP